MKKSMTVLLGLVLAITGISVFAEGPVQKGKAECPMGAPKGMQRHMPQLDEIDKLLIMVAVQEKMQAPAAKGRGPRQMMHKGMMGKDSKSCRMEGKEGKACKAECKDGKPCQMTRKGMTGRDGKSWQKKQRGERKFRGKRQQKGGFKNRGAILKSYLLKNYPKEMEEIVAQKKSNDAADKELLEKFKKIVNEAKAKMKADREKMKAEREQFVKMVEEYKKSKDPKLAEQIKAKISEFYDKQLEFIEAKVDEDAAKVQKAYDKLKEKKADKDKEVSERFEKITK